MSYANYEYSKQDGDPVYRVEFALRDGLYRRTTERNIVLDSDGSWMPSPIKFSGFSQTNELAKDPLLITLPRDDVFAQLFVGGVPDQITTVTVFKLHESDASLQVNTCWKGRVTGTEREGDGVVLHCENISSSMRRPGLRGRYQKNCRHALYHRGCFLNDYDFATVATADAVSGYVVTVPDANDSSTPDGYYTGGILELDNGDRGYITRHVADQVTLIQPMSHLNSEIAGSGSAAVTLYPGCDRTMTTCKEKFNNLSNHGGFAWIPGKNPFGNDVSGSIA